MHHMTRKIEACLVLCSDTSLDPRGRLSNPATSIQLQREGRPRKTLLHSFIGLRCFPMLLMCWWAFSWLSVFLTDWTELTDSSLVLCCASVPLALEHMSIRRHRALAHFQGQFVQKHSHKYSAGGHFVGLWQFSHVPLQKRSRYCFCFWFDALQPS